MKGTREHENICPHCGHRYTVVADACPACGRAVEPVALVADSAAEWARTRDGLKTKWVASVIAFWVSATILGVLFLVEGRLNLVLTSIALGMLVIGVWLKTRYQLHLRKEPGKQ